MARTASTPNPPAQSEIGPTTFAEGQAPMPHGPNDPETKAAYAAGHPSVSTLRRATEEDAATGPASRAQPAADAGAAPAAESAAPATRTARTRTAAPKAASPRKARR